MQIDVCGVSYEVIERIPGGRDDADYGQFDGKMGKIYLDSTMPQTIKDATLVNEWMHGVYEANGIEHQEVHVAVMAAELYRQGFRVKVEDGPRKV